MFCPQCGSSDTQLVEGLCKTCFLKEFYLLKLESEIIVTLCTSCHSQIQEGKWKELGLPEEEIIYQALEENIHVSPMVENVEIELEIIHRRGSLADCRVIAKGVVFGEEITQEYKTTVRLNKTVCPDCSKIASGYYESVIQLRADNRPLYQEEIALADEIIALNLNKLEKKNRMAYITQRTPMKEGMDYYIGSQKAAKKLINKLREQLGGLVKESPRLMGQDKSTGKGLYRTWISLRLPQFSIDDFIQYNDRLAQVKSLDSRKIIVRDLINQEKFSILWKDYANIKLIGHLEDIQKTTLTSKTPHSIQILHPTTFEPIDQEINPDYDKLSIGDEVDVLEIEGKIYIIL
ncbi:MAG: 60S ribosomal export protein NMD3 [Euryarchaeota archaeon]